MAKFFSCCMMVSRGMLVIAATLVSAAGQQGVQPGTGRLQPGFLVPQTVVGPTAETRKVLLSSRRALSLASGDFYEDGTASLVTGYAIPGGGVLALQHGQAMHSLRAGSYGSAATPFDVAASAIEIALRPDLLKVADVNGDGHLDLIVATRNRGAFKILLGNGRGGFGAPAEIAVFGGILSLTPWRDQRTGRDLIAVGVCGASCSVGLYQGDGLLAASIPVAEERPTILELARVNGGASDDLLVGGRSRLIVMDGSTLGSGSPRIDRLPVSGAIAAAGGSFVYDRRGLPQIAVLTADGSVHFLARAGVDASPLTLAEVQAKRQAMRQGQHGARVTASGTGLEWMDAEMLTSVAVPDSGATPLLLRSHISGSGGEDVVALNVNGGQITTIAHPMVSAPVAGAGSGAAGPSAVAATVLPAVVTKEAAATGTVDAAIQIRLSQDSRASLVMAQGQAQPSISVPPSSRVINVNSTADGAVTPASKLLCTSGGAGCTLRSALAVVNADAATNESQGKVDTVNVAAGTYLLTSSSGLDSQGSVTLHIEIAGPVNIVGAGVASTTISTNNTAASEDKIFSINSGVVNTQTGFDVFISNLTMSNGTNPNNYNVQGSSNAYGGLVDWETGGTGYLTFSGCNFTNGTILWGPGGAIYASDTPIGPGTLEIDGGTISGNKTPEEGGGFEAADDVPVILNSVTVTGNRADPAVNSGDNADGGPGGGAYFGVSTQETTETSIVNSVFSSNTAAAGNGEGGGLLSESGLNITNTKFIGNSAGLNGGGIYLTVAHFGSTFTDLTVTGNSAGADGGGITVQAFDSSPVTIKYSRITGNTGGTHTGLANGVAGGSQSSAVNAAENFWGCNGAATGTGCDTAGDDGGSGMLTLTPFVVVSAAVSPNPVAVGSSLTLSGDLAHDSSNAAIPAANLTAFAGVNATLNIAEGATSLLSSTVPLSSGAAATASVTPTVAGLGTASFKVDNATVSVPFTVTGPPTIGSSFGTALIKVGGTTSLRFTLGNPSATVALTGVSFTDTLPAGLVVATPNGLSNSCSGGTAVAGAGSSSFSLSAASIPASGSCVFSLNVLATTAGVKVNTTSGVSSANGGNGPGTTATLNVNAPVVDTLAFGAPAVALGGSTTIKYTVANPSGNAAGLTGVTFSNTLPVGLVVSTPNGASNTCSGTLIAVAGTGTVSLSGVTLAVGASCTVTLNVAAKSSGVKNGSFTASSDVIGPGNTATASVTVTEPVFASPVSYLTGGTGAGSLIVTTADFNGDGIPDLAVANLSSRSVSVMLGNSNGTFKAPVTYAVGYGPYGIVAGDFNKDGKPDLAVVNGGDSTVSILLNSGTGTFPATPSFTYSVGSGPYGISLIDFNKDGLPDLAVTNNGGQTISVLQGSANGSFTASGTYGTGRYPLGTAVGDLNGDGYDDMVVWNAQDGTVGVLLNNKTGGFLPQVTYAVGSDPYSVAIGDFNGDGFADIAVANLGSNTVGVLLNDKTGKFLPQVTYATGVEPTSVLARDMNGDGVLDLIVTNLVDGTVSLLPGKGDGTFLAQVVSPAGTQPYAAVAADFNGDGAPDLAVTNFTTNSIAILLQTPTLGQLVKTRSPLKIR